MSTPTIFDTCRPRGDVLRGELAEADFAADLAQVITGAGTAEYSNPARFFANTYPTRGLLSVYLRKVQQAGSARDQLTAFLTSLFKAVEGAPRAALVYTLA